MSFFESVFQGIKDVNKRLRNSISEIKNRFQEKTKAMSKTNLII